MIEQKFVQYTLWTDCSNNCDFCLHKNNKIDDKIANLNYLIPYIQKDKGYNAIGFIGGEFFNKQLKDFKVKDLFYKAIDLVIEKILRKEVYTFYIAAGLIQKNLDDLYEFLDYCQRFDIISCIVICTSYDSKYRFHNEYSKQLWFDNIQNLKQKYSSLRIHVDTILTEAFLQEYLNNQFDIINYCKVNNLDLDFEEPKTGIDTFIDKQHSLKDFFPKRNTFLIFLKKVAIESSLVDLHRLLNRKLMAEKLYIPNNGSYFIINNRHNQSVNADFKCISNKKYETQIGYIDSDIPMSEDVKQLI